MANSRKASCKVLPFVAPQPSLEGRLEKWFRGVMQSNEDLMAALERLRDAYKVRLAERAVTEADQVVLLAVEVTLNNARNAKTL
jgi:hypothetical protein